MKKKTIKILAVSALLSMTMGCVVFANSDAKSNQTLQIQNENTESKAAQEEQKSADFGTVATAQPALTRYQQHVVKTYNGQPQDGVPVTVDVSYVNGLEIVKYVNLAEEVYPANVVPEEFNMSPLNDNYFYVMGQNNESEMRIIDRYGNVFCQEKKSEQDDRMWNIRLNNSGLTDDSFVLYKSDGNFNYSFYWYTKDGDLIGQIPGDFCLTEDEVDFNDNLVQRELNWVKYSGDTRPIRFGSYSIHGMLEGVLIVRENFIGDGYNDRYYYYDMQNNMSLIAVYTTNSILNTFYPPLIKNGVCYVPGNDAGHGILTVYDDSRIKFGNLESVVKMQDEDFWQTVDPHLYGKSGSIYAFQPSDNGWLIGKGSEGWQAYNIHSGKMVTFLPWNEYEGGHYPLCWWENTVTGYPYEFEKDGLMVVNVREEGYNLTDMAIFDLNAGKFINEQRYEYINFPDYKERPMLYQGTDYQYGYLNDRFEPIAQFKDATEFSFGYALVSQDGWNYSVINENLEVVAENVIQANSVANIGHGLYELQYDMGGYYTYKYAYVGPQ